MNPSTTVLPFAGQGRFVDPRSESLSTESQAALRQFTFERVVGYGVEYADAVQLREQVLRGQPWQHAANALAIECEARARSAEATLASRILLLRRASALSRMSQVMMLEDTDERRAIYAVAAKLYLEAAELSGDRSRVTIDSPSGPIVAWLIPAAGDSVGSAIVIGGVEGYAMDFDSIGEALSLRGIDALVVDAPGQGETRFRHSHYLTAAWMAGFRAVTDYLEARAPGRPIGIVGNSMGGSLAMAYAATDPRVVACINNGGIPAPWMVPPTIGTFFSKMVTFCGYGIDSSDDAVAVWATVTPLASGTNSRYGLLAIHGGADPLVSTEMADTLFRRAHVREKRMVVFSDGIHCIYNHQSDRNLLMADWMRLQIIAASESAGGR